MRATDRAALVAASVMAAVAGSAAVGIAALAHAGICVHHALGLARSAAPMPGMAMPGMAMSGMAASATGDPWPAPCPILLVAAAAAALLYVVSIIAVAALRPSPGEVAMVSARALVRLRFGRLAALLAVAGAVPLGATIVLEGSPGPALAFAGAAVLIAAALAGSAVLVGAARLVLALARRCVDALVAAFRLVPPGATAPWALCPDGGGLRAGVRLARRGRSRAPPSLP